MTATTHAAPPNCDPMTLDQWYPIAAINECPGRPGSDTFLLDVPISFGVEPDGTPFASRLDGGGGGALETRDTYGYLWTTLGHPSAEIFAIPETAESDRRAFNAATLGVHVSGPRAVENFLDMGHLPFVHEGVLGEQPHTEIIDYDVNLIDGEIIATRCMIYQPKAAAASDTGAMVEYTFRVPHPMCALLYKTTPVDPERLDVIGIFVHPLHEDYVRVHLFDCLLDETNSDADIRQFQQGVVAEDKPILENQVPKRLPLDPGAEVPVRADKTAIAYRRWLLESGVTYGVIRSAPSQP